MASSNSPLATFFKSWKEQESGLPAEITHDFKQTEEKLNNDKLQSLWSFPFHSISLLDDLNAALAECHILKEDRSSIKKKTSYFGRSEQNIIRKIKSLVSSINETIKREESRANRNSSTWAPINFWTRQIPSDDEFNILLYGEEEQKIVDCLCSERFKAIGIHGMCGTGKTALVDKVLNSQEVRKMFSPIIKICLSDMSPKEQGDTKIVKHLLEVLGYDVDELTCENRDVDPIYELKQRLKDKKFLIVLDDVWFCNDWLVVKPDEADVDGNLFIHAFPKDTGGAIIVTSRLKYVAEKIVGNECLFHLKPWDGKDDCIEAAMRKLLYPRDAEELLSLIHGLPLAARTLASEKYIYHFRKRSNFSRFLKRTP